MERDRQARFTHPDKWSPPAKSRYFAKFIVAIVVVAALLILAIVVLNSHRVRAAELRPAAYYGEHPPRVITAGYPGAVHHQAVGKVVVHRGEMIGSSTRRGLFGVRWGRSGGGNDRSRAVFYRRTDGEPVSDVAERVKKVVVELARWRCGRGCGL
jgi:hypothetical protein